MYSGKKLSYDQIKQIFLITLSSLVTAFKIRHSKTPGQFSLPEPGNDAGLAEDQIKRMVFWADVLIFVCLFWKPGKCFYRSYALAILLRRWGIPLKINFGCENIHEFNGRARAHCWLTLYEEPFAEKTNPFSRFPVEIQTKNEDIKYWFSDDSQMGFEKNIRNAL